MNELYVDALKALAEPNRLRLYWLLVQINERICVAEAMDVLGQTHYNVSRNLKTLQRAGLLSAERDGKWVFYTLTSQGTAFHDRLIDTVSSIPAHEFKEDIKRCRLRLGLRKEGRCVVGPASDEWAKLLDTAQ